MNQREKIEFKRELKKLITSKHLSYEQAKDLLYEIFADMEERKRGILKPIDGMLYVNQDLKIVEDIKDAVAVVGYFRENEFTGEHLLENLYAYKELVNIAFFEPIAQDKDFSDSFKIMREWQTEHYPNYGATLISEWFYKRSLREGVDWFGPCWTRSRWEEGYPQYRSHPLAVGVNTTDLEEKLPNVYVSLVMNKERFLRLNPDADI